jgi:uncharacterized membrane protein YhaH (DUF805 family)
MLEVIVRPLRMKGRTTRSGYWVDVVAAWLGIMAASPLMFFAPAIWGSAARPIENSDRVAFGAFLAVVLICAWIMVAAAVRRLHDRGKAGWWSIPLLIFPLAANELINFQAHTHVSMNSYQEAILTYLALALGIWGFIEIGCVRGSAGENRYGPPPLPVKWFAAPDANETRPVT